MNTLIKSLFVAGTLIACGATANAQTMNSVQVEIEFDRTDPPSQTFKTVKKQAKKACKRQFRKVALSLRYKLTRKCTAEMTESAVIAINLPSLTAYYEKETGRSLPVTQFAQARHQ